MRSFTRNARLYLAYAFLSGLGMGIWAVAFNLYLLALGYDPSFVGLVVSAELMAHGLMAFPAGIIGDAAGRKRAFLAASTVKIGVAGVVLFVTDDWVLVALSALVGLGDSFHGVVGAPFMMENSGPSERVHLFTASAVLGTLAVVAGAAVAGFVPAFLAGDDARFEFGPAPDGHAHAHPGEAPTFVQLAPPGALRATLLLTLPLNLLALVPLAFMREGPVALRPGGVAGALLLRHVTSGRILARFVGATLVFGLGAGLFFPLINVFFAARFGVSEQEYGGVYAASAAAGSMALLLVPALTRRAGKVGFVVASRLALVPFVLALGFAPSFTLAAALYLARAVLVQLSFPVASMFSMEVVQPRERATTAGLIHAASDLPIGLAAWGAGLLIAARSYGPLFAASAGLHLAGALLYLVFFRGLDAPGSRARTEPAPAPPVVAKPR